MPIFTELNAQTAREYAIALAALFGRTLASDEPKIEDGVYEYALDDGTTAGVWFEFGHVYGEA